MKPVGHIMTATPSYTTSVVTDYAGSLALASAHCILRGVWIEPRFATGFSIVEYARNWLVGVFLKSKATHLFWIDSDLFFPPEAIHKLFARDLDVVAGVYTTKHETKPTFPYTALGPVKDGLQLAEKVPGGFLCMKRHVVEKVVESCEWHEIEMGGETHLCPRFFDLVLEGHKLYGEDFIACERIRRAGFKIYVETDLNFIHFGLRGWKGNLSSTLEHEAATGFAGQGTVGEKRESDEPANHH